MARNLQRSAANSLFCRTMAGYRGNPKKIVPENYIKFTEVKDGEVVEKKELKVEDVHKVVKVQEVKRDEKKKLLQRGFDQKTKTYGKEKPLPCSAVLGPITVKDPEAFTKRYKWCACGMSKKQVDSSIIQALL